MAANTLAPNGFRVSAPQNASVPTYAIQEARIAYNYGTVIGTGDPVYLTSDGVIALYVATGTTIHGIFMGCEYLDYSTGNYQFRPSWPAPGNLPSTYIVKAHVIIDPFVDFIAQVSGTALTQTNVGNNLDVVAAGTGVPGAPNAAGRSTAALASGSGTTGTLPFRVTSIVEWPITRLYDPTGNNNYVTVRMNTSDMLATTGI